MNNCNIFVFDNVDITILTLKPLSMNYLRTHLGGLIILISLFLSSSCNKEIPTIPDIVSVNQESPDLVKDWTKLSLDLITKCNGFNDLIASRSLYYMSLTMYEALLPGLEGYFSLQNRISGLNTTLPQPDKSLQYNWIIVTNQALSLVCSELFKSSGSHNLSRITALRDKYNLTASTGLDETTIRNSKEYGNEMGRKLIEYSNADGRADYYLKNYPDVVMPFKEGGWIPTPPDYTAKILLPNWGESKPAYIENVNAIQPEKMLEYSTSKQSIMFSEATEVYNLTTNLSEDNFELIKYWSEYSDASATPIHHNMLILSQMLEDKDFNLDKAVELLLRISITHYDGYILSWKIKFKSNLLRPSTYIKQNISRFFIPEFSSPPVPEFASEKALIYNAGAEILSHYFGHRTSFFDLSQSTRTDIKQSKKYFDSFTDMAKEAAYSDLLSAIHFRTSIDVGLQMGYDISQKTLSLQLRK